ncbi:MAG: cytochrome b/b6 domain-containing protein [Rhodomicrobium sp.]
MAPIVRDRRVLIWDPLTRVGHWALAIAFAVAYYTGHPGRQRGDLHEIAGYTAGAVVVWRIMWGINGPKYARFKSFVTGPISALGYLFGLMRGTARRYLGHNPAGGAMIVSLLTCLALTVLAGVLTNRGRSPMALNEITVAAQIQAEATRNAFANVHRVLANITFALAVLHVLGVLLACFAHRENLVTAMITGKKRPENRPE